MTLAAITEQCDKLIQIDARTLEEMDEDAYGIGVRAAKALKIALDALDEYPDTNRKVTALAAIQKAFEQ